MRHAAHGRPGQNDRVKTGTRIAAANALMGVGVAPMLHWFAVLADAVLALWLGRYVA